MKHHSFSQYKTTISILLLLSIFAIYSNSIFTPLSLTFKHSLGFAGIHIYSGEIYRYFSSALLTHGAWYYFRAMFMSFIFIGIVERFLGSGKAFFAFWGIHIVTLSIFSLGLYLLYIFTGDTYFFEMYKMKDVGPSAGYVGCLGIIVGISKKRKNLLFLAANSTLIAIFLYHAVGINPEKHIIADIVHLIAFELGFLYTIFLHKLGK